MELKFRLELMELQVTFFLIVEEAQYTLGQVSIIFHLMDQITQETQQPPIVQIT